MVITIHKRQGEDRVKVRGKLEATQHAKYVAALRPSLGGHPYFWSPTKGSVGAVKKHVEEVLGVVQWRGSTTISPDEDICSWATVELADREHSR